MNDELAMREQAELCAKIIFLCKEYADKDGLDFVFVVQKTAEAMLKAIS